MEGYKDCKYYKRAESSKEEYIALVNEYKEDIMSDLRARGISTDGLTTLIKVAAHMGAQAERFDLEAAITPCTYTEVSREGDQRPKTHKIQTDVKDMKMAYCNALKQLGIYVSIEKIQTNDRKDGGSTAGGITSVYDSLGPI